MLICLTICTRERPVLLQKCLYAASVLHVPEGVDLHILVVDNAAETTSGPVLEAAEFPGAKHLVHHPETGLVSARNRALEEADALGADWIGFLDDDETADADWLAEMVAAIEKYAPETRMLAGPRVRVRAANTDPFFPPVLVDTRRYGRRMRSARTNNLLIHRSVFGKDGDAARFDMAFNLTGCEDTEFTRRVTRTGVRMRWISTAIVYDKIRADRATLRYVRSRARWVTANEARIRHLQDTPSQAWIADFKVCFDGLASGLFFSIGGVLLLPFKPAVARPCFGRAARYFSRIAGVVDYHRGEVREIFRKVDGE